VEYLLLEEKMGSMIKNSNGRVRSTIQKNLSPISFIISTLRQFGSGLRKSTKWQ
jgi:hypothetical protein